MRLRHLQGLEELKEGREVQYPSCSWGSSGLRHPHCQHLWDPVLSTWLIFFSLKHFPVLDPRCLSTGQPQPVAAAGRSSRGVDRGIQGRLDTPGHSRGAVTYVISDPESAWRPSRNIPDGSSRQRWQEACDGPVGSAPQGEAVLGSPRLVCPPRPSHGALGGPAALLSSLLSLCALFRPGDHVLAVAHPGPATSTPLSCAISRLPGVSLTPGPVGPSLPSAASASTTVVHRARPPSCAVLPSASDTSALTPSFCPLMSRASPGLPRRAWPC